MNYTEAIAELVELVELEAQWIHDDSGWPSYTYCPSCGARFRAWDELKHDDGCKLAEALRIVREGSEHDPRAMALSIRERWTETGTENCWRDMPAIDALLTACGAPRIERNRKND